MSAFSFGKTLRDGSSLLALSTVLITAQPAQATDGLFGGGSTLASLAERQTGDCFIGRIVTGDGYVFSPSFNQSTPTPGLLPTTCTTHTTVSTFNILELYSGVGSGAGLRGYISNDPKQLFRGSVNTGTAAQTVSLPADPPKFLDSAGPAPFDAYPYPRIDFGAGDSPLPENLLAPTGTLTTTYGTYTYNPIPTTNWQSAASITVTRANTTSTVAYSTGSFGQPIQLPLFEAPVAVAVNLPAVNSSGTATSGGVIWTIKSQFSTTAPGGRIQLSTAQICAIFSGLVTDWNSNATIPYLTSTGALSTEGFAAANTWYAANASHGTGGGTVYASSSVPIGIVYRADGSGTSYIFTNYLKTACPLLDPNNSYGYQSIFNTSVLPNNAFTQLINKVTAYGRTLNLVINPSTSLPGFSGSDEVAAAIGQSAANYGRIGYLSNDFVAPYNPVTTTRPHAASIQNDSQRANSIYHPGEPSSGTGVNFAAATPTSANAAFAVLTAPTATSTWADYNIYAQTFPTGTVLPGTSTSIVGLSKLPLAPSASAYEIVGTAFGYFYSCYGTGLDGVAAATRVTDLVRYLNWYYTDTQSRNIVTNNGFNPLRTSWTTPLRNAYLGVGSTTTQWITARSAGAIQGCTGVTGGAQ
jgi:ABC-type phosphate transport system substrate-binding protein